MSNIPIERFNEMYRCDPDPWGFATRWYEARKYALTLAALPHQRFHRAFEAGCSIGVLTSGLAARCDYLLAGDGVTAAVQQARHRLDGTPHVCIREMILPGDWPDGPWDLVVLSEIGYYFDLAGLAYVLDLTAATTTPGATIVAVHWRGATDYPVSGDAVHDALRSHHAFGRVGGYDEADFLLDVFQRGPEAATHG